jgi:hypothetical protein
MFRHRAVVRNRTPVGGSLSRRFANSFTLRRLYSVDYFDNVFVPPAHLRAHWQSANASQPRLRVLTSNTIRLRQPYDRAVLPEAREHRMRSGASNIGLAALRLGWTSGYSRVLAGTPHFGVLAGGHGWLGGRVGRSAGALHYSCARFAASGSGCRLRSVLRPHCEVSSRSTRCSSCILSARMCATALRLTHSLHRRSMRNDTQHAYSMAHRIQTCCIGARQFVVGS